MDAKPLRCLVVDDEPLVRKLAVRHLIQLGFQCDSTGDGYEASILLEERQYDCVLIDLQVPGKNGHALCVQAINLEKKPIIALMTGYLLPQIEEDLRKRGVKNFYYKPGNLKQIGLDFRKQFQLRATQSDDDVALEPQSDTIKAESKPFPAHSISESSSSQDIIANHDGTSEHFVIVVYCSANNRTEAIAGLLQEEGYPTIAAKSSDHLLETLNSTRVDLLVIERELRGFLNGIQIIESLCDQLLSVNVVLISSNQTERLPETPAMTNVLRQFDSAMNDEKLAEAIAQVLKSLNDRPLMIQENARRLVANAERIPPMPHVLAKIIGYLDQPANQINLDDLTSDIQLDARLTSELLRVTNSSSTGMTQKVTLVRDAIRLLGAKRAITLCVALGVRTMNSELLKSWGDEFRDWYLKRVVLTACVSSIVAQKFEKIPHDSAYLLGILQDLGILVFAEHYGEKYFTHVIERVRTNSSLTLTVSENLVTNTDHAQVSAAILRLWSFPPTIVEPVLRHHSPVSDKESKILSAYVRCMKMAELFADFVDNPVAQRRIALDQFIRAHNFGQAGECGAALLQAVTNAQEMSRQFSTPSLDPDELKKAVAKLKEEDEGDEVKEHSSVDFEA